MQDDQLFAYSYADKHNKTVYVFSFCLNVDKVLAFLTSVGSVFQRRKTSNIKKIFEHNYMQSFNLLTSVVLISP